MHDPKQAPDFVVYYVHGEGLTFVTRTSWSYR